MKNIRAHSRYARSDVLTAFNRNKNNVYVVVMILAIFLGIGTWIWIRTLSKRNKEVGLLEQFIASDTKRNISRTCMVSNPNTHVVAISHKCAVGACNRHLNAPGKYWDNCNAGSDDWICCVPVLKGPFEWVRITGDGKQIWMKKKYSHEIFVHIPHSRKNPGYKIPNPIRLAAADGGKKESAFSHCQSEGNLVALDGKHILDVALPKKLDYYDTAYAIVGDGSGEGYLCHSNDMGYSWSRTCFCKDVDVTRISVSYDGDTVWWSTRNRGETFSWNRSTNRTRTIQNIDTNRIQSNNSMIPERPQPLKMYPSSFRSENNTMYAVDTKHQYVWSSTDQGRTWTEHSVMNTHVPVPDTSSSYIKHCSGDNSSMLQNTTVQQGNVLDIAVTGDGRLVWYIQKHLQQGSNETWAMNIYDTQTNCRKTFNWQPFSQVVLPVDSDSGFAYAVDINGKAVWKCDLSQPDEMKKWIPLTFPEYVTMTPPVPPSDQYKLNVITPATPDPKGCKVFPYTAEIDSQCNSYTFVDGKPVHLDGGMVVSAPTSIEFTHGPAYNVQMLLDQTYQKYEQHVDRNLQKAEQLLSASHSNV